MTSKRKKKIASKAARRENVFLAGAAPDGGPVEDPRYPAWLLARGLDPVQYLLDFPYRPHDELPVWAREFNIAWLDIYEAQALMASTTDLVSA